MIPASGSAYTYTYVVLGELLAWMVGWSLILEYTLVVSAVAVGWSGYAAGSCSRSAWASRRADPGAGARRHHQPAGDLHHLVVAGLLIAGTRESATLNAILVVDQDGRAGRVRRGGAAVFRRRRTSIPSCPTASRESGPSGSEVGVMAAAAIIFFAFYGFDAIATAAEETKNPAATSRSASSDRWWSASLIYMVGGGRRDRRGRLHRLRRQPGAAGADPARDRPAMGGASARRLGGDRACRP